MKTSKKIIKLMVAALVVLAFCSCNKPNTCVKYTQHTSYYCGDSLLRIDDYTVYEHYSGQSTGRSDTFCEAGDIWLVTSGCNTSEDDILTGNDQYNSIYLENANVK